MTPSEKQENRLAMMEEMDDYISECLMYCDDESDVIALGAVLQIISKNIIAAATDKECWKNSVTRYVRDVMNEPDIEHKKRRRQRDSVPAENYKGIYW